jgi:hypothetical protein
VGALWALCWRFGVALLAHWGGFEVAFGWLAGGFGVPIAWLSTRIGVALMWLWVAYEVNVLTLGAWSALCIDGEFLAWVTQAIGIG